MLHALGCLADAAAAAAPACAVAGTTPKRLSDSGLKRETYRAATAMECLVRCFWPLARRVAAGLAGPQGPLAAMPPHALLAASHPLPSAARPATCT